jgi:hypothetical protein
VWSGIEFFLVCDQFGMMPFIPANEALGYPAVADFIAGRDEDLNPEQRIKDLDLVLPTGSVPAANYTNAVREFAARRPARWCRKL